MEEMGRKKKKKGEADVAMQLLMWTRMKMLTWTLMWTGVTRMQRIRLPWCWSCFASVATRECKAC